MALIRSRARRAWAAARPYLPRDGDAGKPAIALVMALLTLLATGVAALQSSATIGQARAQREADRFAIEGSASDVAGVIQAGTAYRVYRLWYEHTSRSNWASERLSADPRSADRSRLQTLKKTDGELADWAKRHTRLLQPPYYDEKTFVADFNRFEADMLRPSVRAVQKRDVETETARAWSGRASTYITILTALAVSLFFLGLAATLNSAPRAMLGVAGVLLGALSFAWTVVVAVPPVHRVPDGAIERVVEARAALWQLAGGGLGATELSPERRRALESAIAAADSAAGLDPTYRVAQLARAEGRLLLGQDLVMATGPSDETRQLTRSAMEDYRTYLEARPEDYSAWWNLGWAAYLADDLAASLKATERAIELSPGQLTLYLNRALPKLALRDLAGAMADVEQAIQTAANAPLDSNSHFLAASDFDLGRLAFHRPAEAEALQQMRVRLREALVALNVLDSPAPKKDAPGIDGVEMTTLRLSLRGTLVQGGPVREREQMVDPDAVGIRLAARSSAPRGATLSARVFVNGVPQPGYDVDTKWSGGGVREIDLLTPYGRAGYALDAGHYDLELYLDGATRWRTSWTVPESPPPAFAVTAAELVAWWERSGRNCGQPTT
ncbi:MAG: hypothetical protein M3301_02165, partial [Chloroflexota bacterium]|nr:hypothetical protein [Chloroflexota bacterium]